MIKKNPLVLSPLHPSVVDAFSASTTFYDDSYKIDFIFSSFDSEEKNIASYIYNFKHHKYSDDLFWMGNLSRFFDYSVVDYLFISNKPSFLINYINKNVASINWGLTLFISTSFNYNIDLLKKLTRRFPNAKIYDVFPKGQDFILYRAVTELSLLKDKFSIIAISDHYLVNNVSKNSIFRFFTKDFNISLLQREFKFRVPCAHKYI